MRFNTAAVVHAPNTRPGGWSLHFPVIPYNRTEQYHRSKPNLKAGGLAQAPACAVNGHPTRCIWIHLVQFFLAFPKGNISSA